MNGRHFGKIALLLASVVIAIGAVGLALNGDSTPSAPMAHIEMASPAQMQQAINRLQADHEAVNRSVEQKLSEEEAKEAERVRALEASRDQAAAEARARAAALREAEQRAAALAARKAAEQAKAAELAAAKPAPKPLEAKPVEQAAVAAPAGDPLSIVPPPPVVQPKRGPIDRVIATANELTDKTLSAANTVRTFFTSAAGKLIGINTGSPRLNSAW